MNFVRKIIRECVEEMFAENKDFHIDEMAYPTSFNFDEFKNIRSFSGKQKYAKERLLGKVGIGSSRAVFKIDDEKVLKVALNDRGISQNSAESEGYKQNYDVLARVFDVDQDDMWIEMEIAKKVSPRRFKELTKTTPEDLVRWLASMRGDRLWGSNAPDLSENEFAIDMQDFISDYQYPVPGDFGRTSSYGEVLRDGVPKIVVVDFGFDENTSSEYDTWRKEKAKKSKYNYAY